METTHTPTGDERWILCIVEQEFAETTHTPTGDESVIRAEYMGALAKETTPTPTGTIKKQ